MENERKELIWKHVTDQKPYPEGITAKRLEVIKPYAFNWKFIWADAEAHLNTRTPDELKAVDPESYEHFVGNIWGLLYELFTKAKAKGLVR